MRITMSILKGDFLIQYLETLLLFLRPAFSRTATFNWFVIATVGFIMRTDNYGVSSIVRSLWLSPVAYHSLLHLFHSSAWNITSFLRFWWLWVFQQDVAYKVNDRVILTGDHTKNVKDGRKIPEVQTLHQDSETGSKPSYFRGHHWGCIGLLTNRGKKFWSTPLWTEIHSGDLDEKRSTRIVSTALTMLQTLSLKGYIVLDAFFSVGPVFQVARESDDCRLHILTRAKKNVTAYEPPKKRRKIKRGRKPMYGKKISLMKLFESRRTPFLSLTANIYDKEEVVKSLVLDLFWKPIKDKLRFILIESSHGKIILMTTDFSLTAQTAIDLYCKRSSIETLFNSFKNLLGGLKYHFWSRYLAPCSRKPIKKANATPRVSSNPEKTKATLDAIHKFVVIQMIVLGVIQMTALKFPEEIVKTARCWLRTPPQNTPSEFMTKIALVNTIKTNIAGLVKNTIVNLIQKHQQNMHESNYFKNAA